MLSSAFVAAGISARLEACSPLPDVFFASSFFSAVREGLLAVALGSIARGARGFLEPRELGISLPLRLPVSVVKELGTTAFNLGVIGLLGAAGMTLSDCKSAPGALGLENSCSLTSSVSAVRGFESEKILFSTIYAPGNFSSALGVGFHTLHEGIVSIASSSSCSKTNRSSKVRPHVLGVVPQPLSPSMNENQELEVHASRSYQS